MSFPGVPIQHVAEVDRVRLHEIARDAIRATASGTTVPRLTRMDVPEALWRPGATFVTLQLDGKLRGCIGSLDARRPLAVDVAENAVGAATRDPRFPTLRVDEEVDLEVKISVLTPPEPLVVHSRSELGAALRPGTDGLTIESGAHRATFLPSVWEQLPRVDDFLDQLWRKAGLDPREWPPGLRISRYRSEAF